MAQSQADLTGLDLKQRYIASWLQATATMRRMFTRDYEYTDGNGKQ